jgi:hypothetical protein
MNSSTINGYDIAVALFHCHLRIVLIIPRDAACMHGWIEMDEHFYYQLSGHKLYYAALRYQVPGKAQ